MARLRNRASMIIPEDFNGKRPIIQTRQVVKAFKLAVGEVQVLKGIDLEFYRGEFVGIIGKSGSGKSTLINMITGIDRPTSGEVIVGETEVHRLSEGQLSVWRGLNMGIVFQFFQLLPTLTLLENIMLPMDFARKYPIRQRRERAMQLLSMVDMQDHALKLPSAISGGQQQRVALARALANDPPILIADEPTGNLDSKTADSVFRIFEQLVAQGKTVVMVTHDASLARRVTRTVLLADGEVVNNWIFKALPTLSHTQMLQVSRQIEHLRFEPGQPIIVEGQPGENFYIITSGVAEVSLRQPNGLDVLVARMEPGQYFGEISLLRRGNASATVRAVETPVEVVAIDKHEFEQMLAESEATREAIRYTASQREDTNEQARDGSS